MSYLGYDKPFYDENKHYDIRIKIEYNSIPISLTKDPNIIARDLKKFNNFSNIKELLVWSIATYDKNKKTYKISVRSRGPIINKVCEAFNGGGHPLASGAVIEKKEDVEKLFNLLDKECERYKNENN